MTKDEALKMAIEALEEAKEQIGGLPALDKLIQDCKEALATNKESSLVQPAQEPDYWLGYGLQAYDEKPHDDATPVYLRPAPQPAQEQDIIKLAELAGFILTDDKTGIDWASDYDEYLPKFADLIVGECISVIENSTDRHRKEYFAELLRKHWG